MCFINKDIEKAINTSDLGLPPQNGGDVIRVTVPSLTEETRKGYCKDVDKMSEDRKLIIWKGSQNTIFLEEAIKILLANDDDAQNLVRQSDWWLKKKKKFFDSVK